MKKLLKPLAALLSLILIFGTSAVMVSAATTDWLGIVDQLFNGNSSTGETDYLRLFFQALNAISTDDEETETDRSRDSKEISAVELAEYQTYVDDFNTSVNAIKSKKPGFDITAMVGLPVDAGSSARITDTVGLISSLIATGTSILFGEDNTVTVANLLPQLGIDTLFNDATESEVAVGTDCTNIISVKGTDFVSNLTADDFYDIDYTSSRYGGYMLKGYLWDCINPDASSAQARVFDLLDDAKFYQTIASFAPGVSFDIIQIKYVDCYVEVKVNKNNQLTYYSTHYKCLVHIDEEAATLSGVDLGSILGMGDITLYESEIIYQDFNWTERPLGDVTGDGKVRADDARLTLRAAAGLAEILPGSVEFQYADVIKDDRITAADARKILRVSADLDSF